LWVCSQCFIYIPSSSCSRIQITPLTFLWFLQCCSCADPFGLFTGFLAFQRLASTTSGSDAFAAI
jgi:hypothetical protein